MHTINVPSKFRLGEIFRRYRDALSHDLDKEKPQLRVLTAQVETAVGVVQVDHDRLDVVEGHDFEDVAPQVEEVHVGHVCEDISIEIHKSVAAEVQLAQLAQAVKRINVDDLDAIVVELEHLQVRCLHEGSAADYR